MLAPAYSFEIPEKMEFCEGSEIVEGMAQKSAMVKFKATDGFTASNVSDGTNKLTPDKNGIYTVTVNGDVNISADIEIKKLTVTWKDDDGTVPGEIVAAIAAAIDAVFGEGNVVVKSVKRASKRRSVWKSAGMAENTRSF